MKRYFEEDGITLHPLTNGTWLAFGEVFKDLPTASLERVAGTTIDPWMPQQEHAKHLRRLQNEMQMLLYTHAVNDSRSARGLPRSMPSGSAEHRHSSGDPTRLVVIRRTGEPGQPAPGRPARRRPCLATAWQALDNTRLADLVRCARRQARAAHAVRPHL
jgi:hypothetical protein